MTEPKDKVYRSRKTIFTDNLIGGIGWGIGGAIGLAIILAVSAFFIGNIGFVPVIGEFILDINDYVLQKNPQLIK